MNIDAVGVVRQNPAIVINTIVDLPRVSFLVDFRGEDSRNLVLDDLHYGRGVNDHEVDVNSGGGVTTRGRSIGRCCQGADGVESATRYTDHSQGVVHLNSSVDVRSGVVNISGDVVLEIAVDRGVDEQDSALIRDFLIVHSRLCGGDQSGNVIAIGKRTRHGRTCSGGVLRETIICFQQGSLDLVRLSAATYHYVDKTISSPAF